MNLYRIMMWMNTSLSAIWFGLGIATGLPECAVAVVGFAVLSFLCWRLS